MTLKNNYKVSLSNVTPQYQQTGKIFMD